MHGPDGKLLASGSAFGYISLWNIETGKKIKELEGQDESIIFDLLEFSPDGKLLAFGWNYAMKLLRATSQEQEKK